MMIKLVLFIILIQAYYSFRINYKILRNNDNPNFVQKIKFANYSFKHKNTYSRTYKLSSFLSNYFTNEGDKYALNNEEKGYLKLIGRNDSDDYKELVKSHEEFIKCCNDIKQKLKYKDIFFFITQKIIKKNLYEFKRNNSLNIFSRDNYTSELSLDYIKTSNIEDRIKEQLIKKFESKLGIFEYLSFGIVKRKSILEMINISTIMLPVTFMGLLLSKMGLFSVAVNSLLTAHFLTFKKDQKKKMKISTFILTMLPILLHSSLGIVCNNVFLKNYRHIIPTFIRNENILAFFINIQLYIASLIYFVNNDKNDDMEHHEYELQNNDEFINRMGF
ncbi:conserved Plasmodium protein, unknown function [Plasmodium vinckei lentum]|uniref:Uncharacterized protein n=1 Tax=Plasmodium vinckei lentum TaxID=138297 RepID=A0A6V7SZA9_PLAVN|nr:conserved Plasmodium protein, unknown function [Plasmodium vinckei lentum]